jgi:hypothetical protein
MNDFGITITAEYNGPDRNDDGWDHDRWNLTLHRGRRTMTLAYKMGMALGREPELAEVLHSLQSDARIDEWDEYDDVLGSMPFSKARLVADEIKRQADRLRTFLGDDYDAFINHEEYDQ